MSGGSLRTSAYLEEEKQWGPRQALHAGQGFGQGSQGLLSKVQLTMMAMAREGHQDQRGDEGGKTGVNGVEYIEWHRRS